MIGHNCIDYNTASAIDLIEAQQLDNDLSDWKTLNDRRKDI